MLEGGNPLLKGGLPTEKRANAGREVGSQARFGFWTVGSSPTWALSCLTFGVSSYLYLFSPGLWTSPLSTHLAHSSFPATNRQ